MSVAAPPADNGCAGSCAPAAAPTGWVRPVDAPIWGGFRIDERPDHDGVDIGAGRGAEIRAASAGTVARVHCDAPSWHGCDIDGSPQISGCGWYADIRHEGNIYTRYCHMLHRPAVSEGQSVAAGHVIGVVGSSGNSSAPHLHFEVHLGDQSRGTAVDPVAFMAEHGAPLGIS